MDIVGEITLLPDRILLTLTNNTTIQIYLDPCSVFSRWEDDFNHDCCRGTRYAQ